MKELTEFRNNAKYSKCDPCRIKENKRANDKYKTSYRENPAFWAHEIFNGCRRGAKDRGIQQDLNCAWVTERLKQIDFKCELSGIEFSKQRLFRPSIDRINNSIGYTKENSRIILESLNYFKNVGTDEDIYKIATELLKNKK